MTLGPPKFSLITCTLGRRDTLQRLLSSLANQDYQRFELILVDQSESDDLDALVQAFARRMAIRRLKSEIGLSRSRNVALRHARGDFLCFPDDDCWYSPDILSGLARRLAETPDLDVILGKTIDRSGRDSLGTFRVAGGPVSKWNVWRSGNSNAMLVRRSYGVAVGGFDESLGVGARTDFQSGEETDFILRVLARGAVASYDPEFKVYHQQVDDTIDERTLARARGYSRGFGRVLRKHRYGVAYLLYRLARSGLRSALAAAASDYALARYKLIWAIGTLRGYLAKVRG
jgi:glycosyltransferase involved in cell wall biosynthesis